MRLYFEAHIPDGGAMADVKRMYRGENMRINFLVPG